MILDIYTDGGWFPQQHEVGAAWAFIIPGMHPQTLRLGHRPSSLYLQRSGHLQDCTNNGAEVLAVAYAIAYVIDNIERIGGVKRLDIYSDSDRPVDAINGLIHEWASNGWNKKSPGRRRVNADTRRELAEREKWILLYAQIKMAEDLGIEVRAIKVPSHSGNYWNDRCDRAVKWQLAQAIKGAQWTA
jgi:ribonuclease HI